MTVTESEINEVRRLTAETDAESAYTDAILTEIIEANDGNLFRAAAEICTEKAAASAGDYDFSADGGSYSRSAVSDKWLKMANYYRWLGGKRSGGTIRLVKHPRERNIPDVLLED